MVKERRYLEVANIFIIKNALKNINRNKARYIIVSIIMIIMIITAVISSMIHLTTSSVIDNYSKRFGASIYFTPDLKKVINLPTGTDGTILIPDIPTNQLIDFSKSDYLKSTLFTGSLHGYSDSLRGLDQGGQENSGQGAFIPSDDNNESEIKRQVPNIVVIGYSDLSLLEDFQLGLREIHKGRFFKDTNECIVSEEFSKLNELEIGDTITVSNVDNQDQILNLHITGIYLDGSIAQPNGSTWAVNNRHNEILTNYNTISDKESEGVYTEAVFYLKSPIYSKKFEEEVREKGLSDIYNINTDAVRYNQIVKPVEGLNKVTIIFSFLILLFGGTVIVLLSILLVRERKYEIGVLRAMGMEKAKVALGLVMESIIIIIMCFVIGFLIGNIAAQPVADIILKEQVQIAKESQILSNGDYGVGVISTEINNVVEYTDLTNIVITNSFGSMIFTLCFAVFLGFISSLAGVIYIMRYEPLKLLSQGG